MARTWTLLGIWLAFGVLFSANSLPAAESKTRVLLLWSYHPGDEWEDRVIQGIQSVLPLEQHDLLIEYLDSKRNADLHHEQKFRDLLEEKYADHLPSFIIRYCN